MNDGSITHHINEHNPLSINIEFNINNRRHDAYQLNRLPKPVNDRNTSFQPSRTPDLPLTDRQIYSKDIDFPRTSDRQTKKKTKRNSMDIQSALHKSSQQDQDKKSKFSKAVFAKKNEFSAVSKKRILSKNETQPFKKTFQDPSSGAGEIKTDRKNQLHKSLKSIIHKIVNSELSKRSLGNSLKGKSPYQSNNVSNSVTARKKINKKKFSGSRSDRQGVDGQQIVQKLNSLKSMTNSILRSEAQEGEMSYYSKKRGRVHIKTDRSLDLIDQIAYYERKTSREQKRKDTVNRTSLNQTNKIIQHYIQFINECVEGEEELRSQGICQSAESEIQMDSGRIQQEQNNFRKQREGDFNGYTRAARVNLSNQVKQLFMEQKEIGHQQNQLKLPTIEQPIKPQLPRIIRQEQQISQLSSEGDKQLRPFLSSELQRRQVDKSKLKELKKQQIQKWGYLLDFIKKNMGSSQADTETVLNEVYWFLERSKNDLQRDVGSESQQRQLDEQFTVKYSQKYEQKQEIEPQEQEDEDVASFREEYTEENQDLKSLNLQTISSALRERQLSLRNKREKELQALEDQRQSGKLTQQKYKAEKIKIQAWTKQQLTQISKARKSIWQGYQQAKGILDKTVSSRYYQQQEGRTRKIMKCLSETYLQRKHPNYRAVFGDNKKQSEKQEREPSNSEYEEQSDSKSQEQKQSQNQLKSPKKLDSLYNKKSPDSPDSPSESNSNSQSPNEQDHSSQQQMIIQQRGMPKKYPPCEILQPPMLEEDDDYSPDHSQQMQAIKQRLLKMKKQHFSGDSEGQLNYEEVSQSLEEYSDEQAAIVSRQVGGAFAGNGKLQKLSDGKYNLQNKLKYICTEDKQDIFQFIFLDLCIQLYQQPCKDNRFMKSINAYITRVQNQAKKKKGVKTNLNVVKQYLKRFTSYLLRTHKPCLNGLSIPMGPTALEMLRYMHDGDYQIREEDEQPPSLIVPVNVFQKFQQSLLPTLQFQEYYQDPEKQQARVGFLRTILHIHNKALFDSLNEFLDHQRPFGIWGKPFPWKRAANFPHNFTDQVNQDKLKRSSQKVIEQCSYVCGLLVDKEQSLVGTAKISQAYVQQIREDRLSRMLANELVQSEQRWLFYDDEQTQVLVEMSSYVWNLLIYEVRQEVAAINKRII